MSFDNIPEDKVECYPCPVCDIGHLCELKKEYWECDNCDFVLDKQEGKTDATI